MRSCIVRIESLLVREGGGGGILLVRDGVGDPSPMTITSEAFDIVVLGLVGTACGLGFSLLGYFLTKNASLSYCSEQ